MDENKENKEILESINDEESEKYSHTSLSTVILQSLVLLGPILWLYLNYTEERWEPLKYNIPIAIIAGILLILLWINYIIKYRKNKSYQKARNKGGFIIFPMMIVVIIISLASFVLLDKLQTIIFQEEGWLFYQTSDSTALILILIVEAPIAAFLLRFLYRKNKNPEWEWAKDFTDLLRQYWIFALILWIGLLYVAMTGITFVTEDKVVYHNWLNPQGITYKYSDVEEIKTGYSGKVISFAERKGDFYYKVSFKGKWIKFGTTSPNEKIVRYNDTYLEIEEFDRALMKYFPKKSGSRENQDYAYLDERYIERFGRIIENVAPSH